MENLPIPRIIYAERLGGDVVIAFEDGKAAIYPRAVLYAIFSQARELRDKSFLREQD
jgi:hypothetical protein